MTAQQTRFSMSYRPLADHGQIIASTLDRKSSRLLHRKLIIHGLHQNLYEPLCGCGG